MKKYRKTALDLTKASIMTSVGASAVSSAGGNASGLTAMSAFLPAMGTAAGAGMALGAVRGLKPRRRR